MRSKNILVTGATGLIGYYLCRRLLEEGFAVAAVSRDTQPGRLQTLSGYQDFQVLTGDLQDESFTQHIFQTHPVDLVFHLAVDRVKTAREGDIPPFQHTVAYHTNFRGTVNLLEGACRVGVTGWIQSSTMNVYDFENPAYLPVDENHPTAPSEPNGLSMLFAEEICRYYGRNSGLRHMILRYPGVYGVGKERGIIAKYVRHCLRGERESIVAVTDRTSDFVYVSDIVDANLLALEKLEKLDREIFNVGSGAETSLPELAELVVELTNADVEIKVKVPRKPRRFYFDIQRAKTALGYAPCSLREGLTAYIDAYKQMYGENLGN